MDVVARAGERPLSSPSTRVIETLSDGQRVDDALKLPSYAGRQGHEAALRSVADKIDLSRLRGTTVGFD
jgi:hypothetical protein